MKYEYDFTNLHLPQKEYILLKIISKHNIPCNNKNYDNLLNIGMIEYTDYNIDKFGQRIPEKTFYKISEKGLCYIQYCKNNFVDNRLPIVISIIALIISLISAYK